MECRTGKIPQGHIGALGDLHGAAELEGLQVLHSLVRRIPHTCGVVSTLHQEAPVSTPEVKAYLEERSRAMHRVPLSLTRELFLANLCKVSPSDLTCFQLVGWGFEVGMHLRVEFLVNAIHFVPSETTGRAAVRRALHQLSRGASQLLRGPEREAQHASRRFVEVVLRGYAQDLLHILLGPRLGVLSVAFNR
ncbi:MAG: hypothetical protein RIS22_672 [Actinomycetota bacterium]